MFLPYNLPLILNFQIHPGHSTWTWRPARVVWWIYRARDPCNMPLLMIWVQRFAPNVEVVKHILTISIYTYVLYIIIIIYNNNIYNIYNIFNIYIIYNISIYNIYYSVYIIVYIYSVYIYIQAWVAWCERMLKTWVQESRVWNLSLPWYCRTIEKLRSLFGCCGCISKHGILTKSGTHLHGLNSATVSHVWWTAAHISLENSSPEMSGKKEWEVSISHLKNNLAIDKYDETS